MLWQMLLEDMLITSFLPDHQRIRGGCGILSASQIWVKKQNRGAYGLRMCHYGCWILPCEMVSKRKYGHRFNWDSGKYFQSGVGYVIAIVALPVVKRCLHQKKLNVQAVK